MEDFKNTVESSSEALQDPGVTKEVKDIGVEHVGAFASKDAVTDKCTTTHNLGAAESSPIVDSEREIETAVPSSDLPSSPDANAEAGKASDPAFDADDESDTKGSRGKQPAKLPLGAKTNLKPTLPSEPLSDLPRPSASDYDHDESATKHIVKFPFPHRPKADFPKAHKSGGKPPSDDGVPPKSKSDEAIAQPLAQHCGRCGEPGWSAGYCPKCGSGNAFGALG